MPQPFAPRPYGNNYFTNAQSWLLYILTPNFTPGYDAGATIAQS